MLSFLPFPAGLKLVSPPQIFYSAGSKIYASMVSKVPARIFLHRLLKGGREKGEREKGKRERKKGILSCFDGTKEEEEQIPFFLLRAKSRNNLEAWNFSWVREYREGRKNRKCIFLNV